ncbi:MAG TPA: response regulator [Chloroflexi bacterium]|nr:response regulator [Chloroflexota bacterium]
MNATRRALIVEDLDFWQDTLREILTDAGYQVWIAASCAEALDALAQRPYQLAMIDPVLDDVNRHNRDGLRVLQYILEHHPEMCAMVVTSSDPKHIRREVADISDEMSADMSVDIPVLWKDEWDDAQFLSLLRAHVGPTYP